MDLEPDSKDRALLCRCARPGLRRRSTDGAREPGGRRHRAGDGGAAGRARESRRQSRFVGRDHGLLDRQVERRDRIRGLAFHDRADRHLLEAHHHRRQREDLEGHRPHHGDPVLLPGARGGRHALAVHGRRLRHHAAQDADRLRRPALGVEGHPAHLDRQADGRGGVRGLALHHRLRRDLHSRRERPGEYDLRQRRRAERGGRVLLQGARARNRRTPDVAVLHRLLRHDARHLHGAGGPVRRLQYRSVRGQAAAQSDSRPTSRSSRGSSRATRRCSAPWPGRWTRRGEPGAPRPSGW